MSDVFLIDGYNLLYAMGVLHGRVGPTGLEKARRALLGLLYGAYGEDAAAVTVVFDAGHAPLGAPAEQRFHGLRVYFAVAHQEADDLIEQLIDSAAVPKDLTVVSDDHRIQQAARRRQCTVGGCLDFLERLYRKRRPRRGPPAEVPEKQQALSPQETQHWLAEFADLADDPALKDVFDPFGFRDEGMTPKNEPEA
jgi:predicted RNA-binding protein with PIN domain